MIIKITSSANRLILCSIPAKEIPEIMLLALIRSASGPIIRLHISGDSGQPCLVPFDIRKGTDRVSPENTRADGLEYRTVIALCICPVKPNLVRTAEM